VSFGTPLKPNIEDRGIVHIDIGSFNFEGLYRGVMGDNRQREKTPGQVVNEFEEILEIEKERAKERIEMGGQKGGSEGDAKVDTPLEKGKSRDKAAEKFDVGSTSLEKGTKVKQIAEEGEYEHRGEPVEVDEEVQEVAEKKWQGLERGEEGERLREILRRSITDVV